jgi:hypothetical protein
MSSSKTASGPRPQCPRDPRVPTVILIPVAPIDCLYLPACHDSRSLLPPDDAHKRPDSGASNSEHGKALPPTPCDVGHLWQDAGRSSGAWRLPPSRQSVVTRVATTAAVAASSCSLARIAAHPRTRRARGLGRAVSAARHTSRRSPAATRRWADARPRFRPFLFICKNWISGLFLHFRKLDRPLAVCAFQTRSS